MKTKIVAVSDLTVGNTVLINGEMKTVGRNSVKTDFFSTTVCGERFPNGIEIVLFPNWLKGELVGYVSQP